MLMFVCLFNFIVMFQHYYCNFFFLLFLATSISYRLLCGQGSITACIKSVFFNKLEFNKLETWVVIYSCNINNINMVYNLLVNNNNNNNNNNNKRRERGLKRDGALLTFFPLFERAGLIKDLRYLRLYFPSSYS